MGTHRQTLLYDFPTLVTFLAGETRVYSNDLMTSSCSLIFKDSEEVSPRGIENAPGQMVILYHVGDLKVFHSNVVIPLRIPFRGLEMVISALPIDLQVGLGDVPGSFPAAVTALLAAAQLALFAPKRPGRCAIEPRVLYCVALAISKEDLQTDIDADVRMLTVSWGMLGLRFRLTDNEGIPMPIGTMHEMSRLWSAFNRAMQFDLENVSQLFGNNEVFFIFVHIAILAVLPELDRMPSVGCLETREADTRDVVLPGNKKAFEGLGEAIRKHLYCCSWYVFTVSFED